MSRPLLIRIRNNPPKVISPERIFSLKAIKVDCCREEALDFKIDTQVTILKQAFIGCTLPPKYFYHLDAIRTCVPSMGVTLQIHWMDIRQLTIYAHVLILHALSRL